jgi:hypothetical protein
MRGLIALLVMLLSASFQSALLAQNNANATADPGFEIDSPDEDILHEGQALARTLAQRFSRQMSVVAAGSTCDGKSDDAPALNAAAGAYAGKARLYVPSGVICTIGSTWVLPSNSTVMIDGTIQLMKGANIHHDADVIDVAQNATHVYIGGHGTIDGNSANQTGKNYSAGIGTQHNGPASSIVVENLTIQNTKNWPVNIVQTKGAWLFRLRLLTGGNSVEFAAGTSHCWADRLLIHAINDQAFSFYGGVQDCAITNSRVSGGVDGIDVYSDQGQAGLNNRILIRGNIVTDNSHFGIAIANDSAGVHQNISIINNEVYGNDTANLAGAADIYVSRATHVLLSKNKVHESGRGDNPVSGILLSSNASDIAVVANVIWNEGQGSNGAGIGIWDAMAPRVLILANRCYDNQARKTMAFCVNGTAGPATQILHNTFRSTIGPANNLKRREDTVMSDQ